MPGGHRLLAVLGAVALLAGCATTPKINWAARVGHYTFDQAVTELGPPEKQARLDDGTIVADWLTSRGYRTAYVSPGYYGWRRRYGYYGPYWGSYYETYSPDYFLRLTFGPDGLLQSWKKFAR